MFIALSGRHAGKDALRRKSILGDLFVPFQRIDRIVGGADQCDIGLLDDVADSHIRLGEALVAEFPYFLSSVFVEHTVITEIFLQLQMAPVEERIADGFASTSAHFKKFLFVGSVACNEAFVHAAGTHEAPL